MVSTKRLDYGFNGYQIPPVPKAPRSFRRRGPRKKLVEDTPICAFELLAAVAGKLLQESESSASSNVAEGKGQIGTRKGSIKQDHANEEKAPRSDFLDQGSCVESAFIPGLPTQEHAVELPHVENDSVVEHTSTIMSYDLEGKVVCDLKLGICDADGISCHQVEAESSELGNLCSHKSEGKAQQKSEDDSKKTQVVTGANTIMMKSHHEDCVNSNLLNNSDNSVQLPLYREPIPSISSVKHRKDVKLGIRDDDENLFRCNRRSTKIRALRPQRRIGYRRMRKMLTSRYWRVAPKLKDCEFPNSKDGSKPYYRNKRNLYSHDSCQVPVPSKRRRLFDNGYAVQYDEGASSESISNSPDKGAKGERSSSIILQKASASSPLVPNPKTKDSSAVKFSIKSFKVPELYVEVPESATIGSLKKTVMEAVTAILGGGLRVGVVLQGKKVRDDNRTLQQAGICHDGNLDTLGFSLEPSLPQVSTSVPPKDCPESLQCDADQNVSRILATPAVDSKFDICPVDLPPVKIVDKNMDNENDLVLTPRTPTDALTDETVSESKALVPVPAINFQALAVVPMNQKTKRSELSQRRTRRPFSVTEVEALVEAVEKLGTGRWRDVKMRAFDNADHRTYVDLKDKWKTLVHTASISPQQRRGEPVPQELLDRVLSAHAYWSQHQSKQHGKHHADPVPLRIADISEQDVSS